MRYSMSNRSLKLVTILAVKAIALTVSNKVLILYGNPSQDGQIDKLQNAMYTRTLSRQGGI